MKQRILMIGYGWRSKFYERVIRCLNQKLEVCGIMMRTKERAQEVKNETGIYATNCLDDALGLKPDFILLCVPKAAAKDWLIRLMKTGIPVLCETPPALHIDDLNELWQVNCQYNGKVQVAEQYFMQPYYSAVQNIIQSGILGDIVNVNMSAIHEYHALSIFRKFLGIGYETCKIRGSRFHFPVTKTRNRLGWHETGEILYPQRDRVELVFENGKTAFYDFDKEHYFSPIRARSWTIQGIRGEVKNMSVCYLDDRNRPLTEAMYRVDDGIYNIDGWSHDYISFRGKRIYENPFPGARLNDDELAIADMLMRMANYVKTGEDFYPLQEGLQDAYLDVCMEEALRTGNVIETQKQSWSIESYE